MISFEGKNKENSTALLRVCSLVDYILTSILDDDFLGVVKYGWINYSTWYNLCGVQYVMSLLQSGKKMPEGASDVMKRFLQAAMAAAEAVVEGLNTPLRAEE